MCLVKVHLTDAFFTMKFLVLLLLLAVETTTAVPTIWLETSHTGNNDRGMCFYETWDLATSGNLTRINEVGIVGFNSRIGWIKHVDPGANGFTIVENLYPVLPGYPLSLIHI